VRELLAAQLEQLLARVARHATDRAVHFEIAAEIGGIEAEQHHPNRRVLEGVVQLLGTAAVNQPRPPIVAERR
jgi:hypothetical protein